MNTALTQATRWLDLHARYVRAQAHSESLLALPAPAGNAQLRQSEQFEAAATLAAWEAGDEVLAHPAPDLRAVTDKVRIIIDQERGAGDLRHVINDLERLAHAETLRIALNDN